ncbi:right-handed parallel beta-helix repeat-containing protein [Natrialba swarupiae]|uniref:Right-handed parallel beta-helix repeat-containing protein n=1 Tax=Natrialba swarupiae TaxID=2448032 RepID=A0A5D5AR36_9EURY|nr:right-handed parallel beta-helix repeat-containing protein [Natrialba swarupiae]TYT63483.1 right-handed parallel beta-helix repeat-containing protein [Natrialba swarupiae]
MARDPSVLDDDNPAATDPEQTERDDSPTILRRRSYLKWAGTAAGAALATSAPAAASSGADVAAAAEVANLNRMSERELSIAEGEDLSRYVANASNGELLIVPEGTYEWNRTLSFSRRNWGIVGDGDVTIMVPGNRGHGTKNDYVLNASGNNVFVANLTFDSDGRPATGFRCIVNERAEFRDITVASDGPRTWDQSQTNMFNVGAESSSGEVLFDGLVAYNNGNISQYNGGQSRIGIWCSRSGKLTVRNSVISGFPNNGIYTRMPGEMEIDNCVFANNNVGSIRLGGSNEVVKNSTFYLDLSLDDSTSSSRGNANAGGITADNRGNASNGGYVQNCSFIVREIPQSTGAIRFLDNNWIDVEDCQFLLDQGNVPGVGWNNSGSVRLRNLTFDTENGSGATVASSGGSYSTVENVCVSSDLLTGQINASSRNCSFDWEKAHDYPNPEFEDREEDDSGNGSEEPELGNTLVIDGEGSSERSDYQFEVDGEVDHSEYHSEYGTGGEIDGGSVAGFVRGGADGFRFEGELVDLEVEDGPTVRVNGIEVDPADYGDEDDEDDQELSNTLVIDGEGSSERSDYQFEVDGEVDHSEYHSEYGTGGEIDGGSVAGFVRGGADGFRFEGELVDLEVEDGPTVRVNGIEVDPDRLLG